FAVIVIGYRLRSVLGFKYKWVETIVDDKQVYIIKNGTFAIEEFKKESVGNDELYSELCLQGACHVGQVGYAILETSGELIVYFIAPQPTKYGLPILPDSLQKTVSIFKTGTFYSCTFSGQTIKYRTTTSLICPQCNKQEWIKASNRKIS